MKAKWMIGVLLAVALLGVACGGSDGGGDTTGGETSENGGETSGGETVTLNAADFAFDPTSLSAATGDTIEFTNGDDAEHNITAEDAGIDEDVEANGSTTIDLAGVEPGTYDFICEYHPDTMKGTLEVTE